MKNGIVYIVMNEGEVVYASNEREVAETYANNKMYEARGEILDEWENDDATDEDIAEAEYQSAFYGECYEVEEVNISNLVEDDVVETLNGTEIEVSDILEKLELSE